MRLAALIAAKRFGQRRLRKETPRRRAPWFALTLRWRQSVKPAPLRIGRAPSPAVSRSWFSQFHLHFGLAGKPSERQTPWLTQATQITAIVWRQMREKTNSARPNAARAFFGPGRETTQRRPRQELTLRHCMIRALPNLNSPKTAQVHSRRKEQAVPGLVDLPPRRAVMRALAHRSPAENSTDPNFPRRSSMKPAALAVTEIRRHIQKERRNEPLELAKRHPPVMPQRAPDLVWRATAKTASIEIPEAAVANVTRLSPATARAAAQAPASRAAWQTQASAGTSPVVLDNAMVDRLAEDVIRRVERRIRIERERRGV